MHYYPRVLTPEVSTLAELLDDTQSLLEQEDCFPEMLLRNVSMDSLSIEAAPSLRLALLWVVFCNILNYDVHPTTDMLLLSVVDAAKNEGSLWWAGDTTDFWSLSKTDEEWLRWNVVVNHPMAAYAPWINNYPSSWRYNMTLLTLADWSHLSEVLEGYRSRSSPLTQPRNGNQQLSLCRDGYVWFGALIWVMQRHLDQALLGFYEKKTSEAAWFALFWRSPSIIDELNLPPLEPSEVSSKCREAAIASGHSCYFHKHHALEVYAVLLWRIHGTDNIPLLGLGHNVCSGCKAKLDIECTPDVPQQINPSMTTSSAVHLLPITIEDISVEPLSSTMVMLFDGSLSQFEAPSSSAGQWLEANSYNITQTLGSFPGFAEKDRSECRLLVERIPIYQVR